MPKKQPHQNGKRAVGQTRTAARREMDLKVMSELYLKGLHQYEMAKILKVTPATIHRDLVELHKRWLATQTHNMDEYKSRELAKLDKMEAMALEAYERSVGKMRRKKTTSNSSDPEAEDRVEVQEWMEAGDPAFMNVFLDCVRERKKILGLDAATKVDMKQEITITTAEELEEEGRRLGITSPRYGAQLPLPSSN